MTDQSLEPRTRIITVTFGPSDSRSGPRTVSGDAVSMTEELILSGYYRKVTYYHKALDGTVVAVKHRWEHPRADRVFTSYRLRHDVPIPLLGLNRIQEADEIWLSESHSDALALRDAGVCGTTNWGSASEWNTDYAAQLVGKQVIVVRHKDEAGHAFADAVVGTLPDAIVVEPLVGNDAREHLEHGHGLTEFKLVRDV
jgi:hypothetical protein